MKPTHIIFIIGKFDCLPSAKSIPIGKEATIPVIPTIKDKVKPPIFRDSTGCNAIVNKIFKKLTKYFQKTIKNIINKISEPNPARTVFLETNFNNNIKVKIPRDNPM